jgi:hypothetical protein
MAAAKRQHVSPLKWLKTLTADTNPANDSTNPIPIGSELQDLQAGIIYKWDGASWVLSQKLTIS